MAEAKAKAKDDGALDWDQVEALAAQEKAAKAGSPVEDPTQYNAPPSWEKFKSALFNGIPGRNKETSPVEGVANPLLLGGNPAGPAAAAESAAEIAYPLAAEGAEGAGAVEKALENSAIARKIGSLLKKGAGLGLGALGIDEGRRLIKEFAGE